MKTLLCCFLSIFALNLFGATYNTDFVNQNNALARGVATNIAKTAATNIAATKQNGSSTLTNLSGTGALTNSALFIASTNGRGTSNTFSAPMMFNAVLNPTNVATGTGFITGTASDPAHVLTVTNGGFSVLHKMDGLVIGPGTYNDQYIVTRIVSTNQIIVNHVAPRNYVSDTNRWDYYPSAATMNDVTGAPYGWIMNDASFAINGDVVNSGGFRMIADDGVHNWYWRNRSDGGLLLGNESTAQTGAPFQISPTAGYESFVIRDDGQADFRFGFTNRGPAQFNSTAVIGTTNIVQTLANLSSATNGLNTTTATHTAQLTALIAGGIATSNLMAMGITNIVSVTGTASGIGTNGGTLWITNTLDIATQGGAGNLNLFTNATAVSNLFASLNFLLGPNTNVMFAISNSSATGPGVFHLLTGTNGASWRSALSINLTNGFAGIASAAKEKLSVAGAVAVSGTAVSDSASTVFFDYIANGARIIIEGPDSGTRGKFTILQASSTGASQLTPFFIDATGLVGINNTTPSYKLHVSGDAYLPTNAAPFTVVGNAPATLITNLTQRATLVLKLAFDDVTGGIPSCTVVATNLISTNNFGILSPTLSGLTLVGTVTITNDYTYPMQTNAIFKITDTSTGGAAVRVVQNLVFEQ